MNYEEARAYLEKVNELGSVLGLDAIKNLLERLGNPEEDLQAVHVAGTNGKGSVSTFLKNILMRAGYRVGSYSSPAVFEPLEIIRVNNQYIDEESVSECITLIKEKCDEMTAEGLTHPTSFEIETAMALLYFCKMNCDVVIIECGMGGETDATNVFEKVLCSVITTVSLDHMKFLGDTVEEIARMKAGIIKEKCPVVVSLQNGEVMDVMKSVAFLRQAPLMIPKAPHNIEIGRVDVSKNSQNCNKAGIKTFYDYLASDDRIYCVELNTIGAWQITNSITAIETALVLERQGFSVRKYIVDGIGETLWNGRMEVVSGEPLIVIDGAHNPGAVMALRQTMDFYFSDKKVTFIMGVLADKDYEQEAQLIAGRAEQIITVTPDNPRALDGRELAEVLKVYNQNTVCADSLEEAVHMAKKSIEQKEADMILAFGSLSYLGKLKSVLKNEFDCD